MIFLGAAKHCHFFYIQTRTLVYKIAIVVVVVTVNLFHRYSLYLERNSLYFAERYIFETMNAQELFGTKDLYKILNVKRDAPIAEGIV